MATEASIDIHTATIFESKAESSVFYQRQVDDVIVVNSKKTNPEKQPRTQKPGGTSSNGLLQASSSKALIEGLTNKSSVEAKSSARLLNANVAKLKPIEKQVVNCGSSLSNSLNLIVKKADNEAELDIEEKILRRREMAHLFQWYYPEGGWGWVILLCAFVSQTLAHGLQLGFAFPLGVSIRRRFYLEEARLSSASENGSNQAIVDDEDQVIKQPIVAQHIGKKI